VTLSPNSIDFGDTVVGTSDKTAKIMITNNSPLTTKIRFTRSSKSLVIPPSPIEIPGYGQVPFKITFYPQRVYGDYSASVSFTNINNPSNELQLAVTAIIVTALSESRHLLCSGLF
jgi:hypothetical protein